MNLARYPEEAWKPISPLEWSAPKARHLLRRASWTATPEGVRRALRLGPEEAVDRLFSAPPAFPMPESVAQFDDTRRDLYRRARDAATPEERRALQRESRQKGLDAFQEMTTEWLRMAALPPNAAWEKWVAFLQDVFVVSFDRVRNPTWLFRHHDLLRQHAGGSYLELCQAVSRSPAMIHYLDLQRSRRTAPNENFARELFELFILGEGNYTEQDIKEAARAFTGYRERNGEFAYVRKEFDSTQKRVFGRAGNWSGDDVIRLAFEQDAAATFLPAELCRFYLTDRPLPQPVLEALGRIWRESGFNLGVLVRRFFTSRLFYRQEFQGNLVKSPQQFHLGLMQDLQLTPPPFPRGVLTRYRQMGQDLYRPPNVRGWVGGRLWISSSTLSARRQLVESLFRPVDEEKLNADERRALRAARKRGKVELYVSRERLRELADSDPETIARHFTDYFLPRSPGPDYRRTLTEYLANGSGSRLDRVRNAAVAVLQSPAYHLC